MCRRGCCCGLLVERANPLSSPPARSCKLSFLFFLQTFAEVSFFRIIRQVIYCKTQQSCSRQREGKGREGKAGIQVGGTGSWTGIQVRGTGSWTGIQVGGTGSWTGSSRAAADHRSPVLLGFLEPGKSRKEGSHP